MLQQFDGPGGNGSACDVVATGIEHRLSAAQLGIWIDWEIDPAASNYNVSEYLEIFGAVDAGLFEQALRQVVAEVEALNVRFVSRPGAPRQIRERLTDWPMPVVDFSASADSDAAALAWMQADVTRLVDPLSTPLFAYALFKVAEDRWLWYRRYHHIVMDGFGATLSVQRLAHVYSALMAGGTPDASPFGSLAQVLDEDDAYRGSSHFVRDRSYWSKQLTDCPEPASLSAAGWHRSAPLLRRTAYLTLPQGQALRELAKRCGVSLPQVVTAASAAYLHRMTGEEDLILGCSVGGRLGALAARTPGMASNVVPIRLEVRSGLSFGELARQTARRLREALRYQRYRIADMRRDIGRVDRPLYGIQVNIMPFDYDLRFAGARAVAHNLALGPVDDLSITIYDRADGGALRIDFNANPRRYGGDELDAHQKRFLGFLAAIIEQGLADDTAACIGELPLLTGPERRQVVEGWNATAAEYPRGACLHELIAEQVLRTPDAVAVVAEEGELSYAELDRRANRLAHHLRALGVGPDVVVGLYLERSLEMVVGLLGILKAGGAYLPLDPEYPRDRLAFMLSGAGARVLVTVERLADDLAAQAACMVRLDADWGEIARRPVSAPPSGAGPANLAYVIYTSGSTGKPKGVMNEHGGVVNRLCWMQAEYGLTPRDSVLQKTPFTFDVSVWEFLWPLMQGARLVMARPGGHKDPSYLIDVICRQIITTLHFVPSMLQVFLQEREVERCLSIKRVICSGEALSGALQGEFFQRLDSELHNLYGPTEAAIDVTSWACRRGDAGIISVPIGRPIWNTQIFILNASLSPVPIGVAGELHIGGVGVARGYIGRADLTAERFIASPLDPGQRLYRTGDLARWSADGVIEYLGRIDHQVKIRGFRIELGEVEAALRQYAGVREAAVVVREDAPGDKRLVAYVVGAEGAAVPAGELRELLKRDLPDYMVPSAFVALAALPLSHNGKLDRKALPAPDRDATRSDTAYVAPRNAVETALATIWEEVLRIKRVGVLDKFFDIGGDSILSLLVVSKANRAGVRITPKQMFQHPTVAALAAVADTIDRAIATDAPVTPSNFPEANLGQHDLERLVSETGPYIERVYPLSPMQQGMLFHSLLDAGSGVYVTQLILTLADVNVAALRDAWERVLRHHDALRTAFVWRTQDNPLQVVLRDVVLPWAELDWRDPDPADRSPKLDAFLSTDRGRGFDLHKAPLMRLTLIRTGEHRYELIWSHHHLLVDGWSVALIVREVAAAYQALVRGREPPLSTPRPYHEYIGWLRRQDMDKAEAFWRRSLAGFEAPTTLSLERSSRNETGHQGDAQEEQWHGWSARATAGLKAFAAAHNLTLSTIFHGAWAILLSRYSGEADVLFGSVGSGRPADLPGVESMVGLFINTLPVRTAVRLDAKLVEWLVSLQEQLLDLRGYEYSPLVDVQGWSEVPRDQSLFETLLAFENYPVDPAPPPGEDGLEVEGIRFAEQLDTPLALAVFPGEELRVRAMYSAHRFDQDTMARVLGHFHVLVQAMVAEPDGAIGQLGLLTAPERRQLLEEWNPREVSYPADSTLHALFEAQAERSPAAIAVSFAEECLTYRELNGRANQLAHHLRECGVGRDVLVAVCLDRGLNLLVGLIGILKAGGAYVPIDMAYPKDRIAFMLADAGVRVIVTDHSSAPELPLHAAQIVLVDGPELARRSAENPLAVSSARDLAYVIYTSGSTGKPKGVLIEHHNVVRLFRATQAWFDFSAQDVWTLFHSPAFDFSVWEIWGALLYGGRLVVVPYLVSRSPEAFRTLLAHERVTMLNQTPSAFNQLVQADAGRSDELSLRYVVFGGEALNMRDLAPWFERHGEERPRLINMYGITETTVHVTYRPLSPADVAGGSVVGVPIPDLQVYILDGQLEPVPIGVVGEMFVGGAGLARGYLNRPEITAERFVPNPFCAEAGARLYRSGDLARFLPGREIEYLGRIDHQVKIRGFRIELGEIEAALRQHPVVREAAVVVREDAPGDKRLVAYVVAAEGAAVPAGELRELLKRDLPDYMLPSAFVTLAALPLTHNGKLDRKPLPAPDLDATRPDTAYVAPRNPVETALATIWEEVLRVKRVGVLDKFFDIGGDSILSLLVVSRANRAGLRITPKQMFQHPTVAALATAAETIDRAVATDAPVSGPVPLTAIQWWFFEQEHSGPHHWNQAVFLQVAAGLDPELMARGLQALVDHHDALRLRFDRQGSGWSQVNRALGEKMSLSRIDLSAFGEADRKQVLDEAAADLNARLDLTDGPLLRAAWFDLGGDEAARLLIVIHHLVVDGVSWRILLEDLQTACERLRRGQPVELPAKTTSFKEWAERINNFARSDSLRIEEEYWSSISIGKFRALPVDLPPATATEASARTVSVALDAEETRALLREVPQAYNTQINDVLLAALGLALAPWMSTSELRIDLEGHGRDGSLEGVDLSRTVGWFTALFPVRLDMKVNGGPGALLKSLKEQLRRVPNRGIGYGLLRYLADRPSVRGRLSAAPPSEVAFNYLGQLDQTLSPTALFSLMQVGAARSPTARLTHLLTIDGLVIDGRLRLDWTYSENVHRHDTIAKLAQDFLAALRGLIRHCTSIDARSFTPSDFSEANMSQEELDALVAEIGDTENIETIYPQSPSQQRMMFPTLLAPESGVDIEQGIFSLQGDVNVSALKGAWERTVERHDVLRTLYVSSAQEKPLQVARRRVALPWEELDWRGASAEQQRERRKALIAADRRMGFDLSKPPLMRVTVIRLADSRYEMIWTHHHILLDGWSVSLIIKDVVAAYAAHCDGNSADLPYCRPYREFIGWLQRQDASAAEPFWRAALRGYRAPTPLSVDRPVLGPGGFVRDTATHRGRISAELSGALKSFAKRHNLTLGTLAHGAWAVILSRYSGHEEVLFGSSASGRPAELDGVESMVGLFTNTLPVPIRVPPGSSLLSWLEVLQDQLAGLRKYEHSSLADIQGWSELRRDQPMFLSLLAFENYPIDASLGEQDRGLKIDDIEFVEHTNYPLVLVVVPGTEMAIVITYDVHRFDAERIARLFGHFEAVFKTMVAAPDAALAEVPIPGELLPTASVRFDVLPPDEDERSESETSCVTPRNPTEEILAMTWCRVLGLRQIGVRDDFFNLGAHSLSAVRVVNEVNRTLNINLGVAALFRYRTIEQLAGTIARLKQARKSAPTVVQLGEGGGEPAVYFIYAGVHEHRIAQMVEGRPIFGIDVPLRSEWHVAAQQNRVSALPTMEELIAPYLETLSRHVGRSPCILAGYCFAGVMAFELAHQFQKRGGQVKQLMLIDAPARMPAPHELAWRHLRRAWGRESVAASAKRGAGPRLAAGLKGSWRAARWLGGQGVTSIWSNAKRAGGWPDPGLITTMRDEGGTFVEFRTLQRLYANLYRTYKPMVLDIPGAVFVAQAAGETERLYRELDESLGWRQLFLDDPKLVQVPGTHEQLGDNNPWFARHMMEVLERHTQCLP